MADRYLVRERIEAGRRLLAGLSAAGVEVVAAYWAILGDRDSWELYVGIPGADDPRGAYASLNRVFGGLSEEDQDAIGRFGARVVSPSSRITQAVMDHARRYPRAAGNRLETTLLGGEYVESLYAYPLPAPAPAPVA